MSARAAQRWMAAVWRTLIRPRCRQALTRCATRLAERPASPRLPPTVRTDDAGSRPVQGPTRPAGTPPGRGSHSGDRPGTARSQSPSGPVRSPPSDRPQSRPAADPTRGKSGTCSAHGHVADGDGCYSGFSGIRLAKFSTGRLRARMHWRGNTFISRRVGRTRHKHVLCNEAPHAPPVGGRSGPVNPYGIGLEKAFWNPPTSFRSTSRSLSKSNEFRHSSLGDPAPGPDSARQDSKTS